MTSTNKYQYLDICDFKDDIELLSHISESLMDKDTSCIDIISSAEMIRHLMSLALFQYDFEVRYVNISDDGMYCLELFDDGTLKAFSCEYANCGVYTYLYQEDCTQDQIEDLLDSKLSKPILFGFYDDSEKIHERFYHGDVSDLDFKLEYHMGPITIL